MIVEGVHKHSKQVLSIGPDSPRVTQVSDLLTSSER